MKNNINSWKVINYEDEWFIIPSEDDELGWENWIWSSYLKRDAQIVCDLINLLETHKKVREKAKHHE